MKSAWEFRDLQANPDHWVNPCDVIQDISGLKARLHPGQAVRGNMNAEILLLGQDWAAAQKVTDKWQWKNDITWPTDKSVVQIFEEAGIDIFYANAFWFLKNSADHSSSITSKMMDTVSINANKVILDHTIKSLPNLKKVIVMSKMGWAGVAKMYGLNAKTNFFDVQKRNGVDFALVPHLGSKIHFGFKGYLTSLGIPAKAMKQLNQNEIRLIIQKYVQEGELNKNEIINQFSIVGPFQENFSILSGKNPFLL